MSAICGIYYYDGRLVTSQTGTAMMDKLGIYPTDASGVWWDGSLFLGCQSQHITPESVREIIPFCDTKSGLTITADAIIDNRDELFDKLDIAHSDSTILPDSLLILQAYQKWGQDCPNYLLGDFSFAIWDENKKRIFCAVDHTGTRSLYYYQGAKGVFAFSTLMKPLFVLPEVSKEVNETWFADFLAMDTVLHQIDPCLTQYKNICLLPAGHSLTVTGGRLTKTVYWQVEKQAELKLKSDSEYEEALREVLGEAIRCRMRSIRPVGVMMSGGLDSTTVACMAARNLSKKNQRLEVFSVVPMAGYQHYMNDMYIADETPYIEAVREHAGNIDVTYCREEGSHCLSNTSRLLSILEQPYKIFENLFWLDGLMVSAKKKNIGVMLHGSAGNVTISWGCITPYLLTLLRSGHWYSMLKEGWRMALRFSRPQRLKVLKKLFKPLILLYLRQNKSIQIARLSPIHPDFAHRFSMKDRWHQFGFDLLNKSQLDSWESRKGWFNTSTFSHLGVISTKLSLANQIAWRDPTMDKRVIEFCLSVPDSQYVKNGIQRSLIRRAMAGILPDMVRLNESVHGKQSADLAQRLQPCWPEIANEIETIGELDLEQEYLDIKKIKTELGKYRILKDHTSIYDGWRMLIRSLIFSRYLRSEK